jgi:hypothetical protein
MTKRVLTLTIVAVALLVGGWFGAVSTAKPETLRSRHSEPSNVARPLPVAVTAAGKLYHNPNCSFIHGPVRMESSAQAIAEGYTPCPRCLKQQ